MMLPTQPLDATGIVEAGFAFYRATFARTWKLALLAAAPYALASAWFTAIAQAISLEIDMSVGVDIQALLATLREATMQAVQAVAPIVPLMLLGMTFIIAVVGHRLVGLSRGETPSARDDFFAGLTLLIPLTLVMALYVALTTLGSALFVVPGIILSVSMCLFFFVPLMEERSAWSSLWRSHALVWGEAWWRTASVLTLVSLIAIGVRIAFAFFELIIGLVLSVLGLGSGTAFFAALTSGAVSGAMMAVMMALTTCIFLVLYNDLLLRKAPATD